MPTMCVCVRFRLVGSFYVNYVDPKIAQSTGYEALNLLSLLIFVHGRYTSRIRSTRSPELR